MLESLVSLSILALFIGVVFPFCMDMMVLRSETKTNSELSRFLYESAMFYKQKELGNRQFHSGDVRAYSVETGSSIHIYVDGEKVSGIDLVSVEWMQRE